VIIAIDVDGTICHEREVWWEYEKCVPIDGARETLLFLKNRGHKIVLSTARFESDREVTEKWLSDHDFVYDEIFFNKPKADLYIDNLTMTMEGLIKLIHNIEGGKEWI